MFQKKSTADDFEPADLEVLFEHEPGCDPEPYERLLGDALHGVHTLFTRQDSMRRPGAWCSRARPPGQGAPLQAGDLGTRGGERPGQGHHQLVGSLAAGQLSSSPEQSVPDLNSVAA